MVRRANYKMATNQWVLIPRLVNAIREGHNTLPLLLTYFGAELKDYCNEREQPFNMLGKLLTQLHKRNLVHYHKGERTWIVS